jgi:hypothetical protein
MEKFTNIIETDTGKQIQFIDSRYYQFKDEWFPGISTILDVVSKGSQYDKWLMMNGGNAQVLAREAMNQGSHVHEAIQDLCTGKEISFGEIGKPNYTRNEWQLISKFIDFYTGFKPEIIAVEKVLVSKKLGFGSQIDLVVKLNNKIIVIDHKTGSVYDNGMIQVSAYIKLWNEYFGDKYPATDGAILHLESTHKGRDSKGKSIQGKGWILLPVEEVEKNFEDFKHIQAIWQRKNPSYRPFNEEYPATYKLSK